MVTRIHCPIYEIRGDEIIPDDRNTDGILVRLDLKQVNSHAGPREDVTIYLSSTIGIKAYTETWVVLSFFGIAFLLVLLFFVFETRNSRRQRERNQVKATHCGILGADDAFPAYSDDDSSDADDGGGL